MRKHSDTTQLDNHEAADSAIILSGQRLPSEAVEDTCVSHCRNEGRKKGEMDDFREDIMWVDWDGPDDPANPKKYDV